jgi:hypothetical protein
MWQWKRVSFSPKLIGTSEIIRLSRPARKCNQPRMQMEVWRLIPQGFRPRIQWEVLQLTHQCLHRRMQEEWRFIITPLRIPAVSRVDSQMTEISCLSFVSITAGGRSGDDLDVSSPRPSYLRHLGSPESFCCRKG